MDADKSADKLRRAAERDATRNTTKAGTEQRETDSEMAAAQTELTQPELSKGRPPARNGRKRPSNAGTDGP